MFLCLTIQTNYLSAKESYNNNNKILGWYSLKSSFLVDSLTNKEKEKLVGEVTIDIFESIPTPLKVAILIKDIGTAYHKDSLSNPDSVDNYTHEYKKALNLGIYCTDLGYANLYQENQDAINYLNSIHKLYKSLNIIQPLEYDNLKELIQNNEDSDYLLKFTAQKFDYLIAEFTEQRRQHLGLLMITGGWLESVYITSLVYKDSRSKDLKNKIGEQKLVLYRILLALDVYKDKPNFESLINELELLQKTYQNVEIVEKDGQPKMEVRDGQIVIIDSKETIVTISNEDARIISNLVASIRNKIITN
ncbi:MAG: hypothetical protein COZ18_05720 [Flexibacter sp. CG_4_10_14_3_um_filter_32_15]|nr:MAG: hypothetical protein COZ18_05720 [Flexibacter sp. CG_4_10_14_3_um_filter_32_15]